METRMSEAEADPVAWAREIADRVVAEKYRAQIMADKNALRDLILEVWESAYAEGMRDRGIEIQTLATPLLGQRAQRVSVSVLILAGEFEASGSAGQRTAMIAEELHRAVDRCDYTYSASPTRAHEVRRRTGL